MKKYLIVGLFAVFLSGCASRAVWHTVSIDYTSYYNEGFFITESNSVSFDYEPVGSFVTTVISGTVRQTQRHRGRNVTRTVNKVMDHSDALNELVYQCKQKGADAVINVKYRVLHKAKSYDPNNTETSYEISGMAIKRK